MPTSKVRPAPLSESDRAEGNVIQDDNPSKLSITETQGKWRERYRVHPTCDVFPMMSDEELAALGGDILVNGLKHAILFHNEPPIKVGNAVTTRLIDGRNRLEAMERVGLQPDPHHDFQYITGDPVRLVISLNINRRHLTKAQQADLIVAAIKAGEKPPQVDEVSKGGRGKVNEMKAEAVAAAKEHGIGKSTVERAIAKAEGRKPKPKQKTKAQKWRDENPDYPTYEQVCAAADAEKEGSDPDAVRKLFGDSPNIGCNFDPEDPRGADEDEGVQIVRRRAWLYMADEAKRNAASFLAEHGHRAIAQADATEIDAEVIKAVSAANDAWEAVMGKLIDVVGDQVAGRALIESEDAAA